MLYAHYSNRTETLADALAGVIAGNTGERAVFDPDVVVVNNAGMGRWLQLRAARVNGIAANLDICFPAEMAWRLLGAVLRDVPGENPFAASALAWHIFARLDLLRTDPKFAALVNYLEAADEYRQWALARRLAHLFDQYLVYRPDWIRCWEDDAGDHWQATLWRELAAGIDGRHWADLTHEFAAVLDHGPPPIGALPSCINVFGVPSLSPAYLELLRTVSHHVDVHLYWFSPCREYWADIATPREAGGRLGDAGHYERGNALLANWGRQGRETLKLIQDLDPLEAEYYETPEADTLLAAIQRDILDLANRGDTVDVPWPDTGDDSISIHACHSPMREVEVLHDQLLARFADDASLAPDDVLVMTPDMERYAPFIEAVFGSAPRALHIPFTIADQSVRTRSPVLSTLMSLLDLPRSRLTAEYVMGIVEDRAVAGAFELSESDLLTIREYVGEAGARWGFDAASRRRLGMPETAEHTWQAAFDRLVLGYAMPVESTFAGTLPLVSIEVSQARALGRFHRLVTLLAAYSRRLAEPRPAEDWPRMINRLIDDLFRSSARDEAALRLAREAVAALAAAAAPALAGRALGLDVVRGHLEEALAAPAGAAAFLGGGVTFCATVPMRSIPFELICMIGMDDGAFPRSAATGSLDLMATDHRVGDRSRREDDRYLFLETILSARRALYISYVGRDVRDDSERPPSVVVSDLVDYVGQGLVDRGRNREQRRQELVDRLVTRHPLQSFDPRYFQGSRRLPGHQPHLARAAAALRAERKSPRPFIRRPLPLDREAVAVVSLEQLVAFFANPVRYLLRNALDLWLDQRDHGLEDNEPFQLDYDAEESLRRLWLERYAADGDVAGLERELRQRALLPHGVAGRLLVERELGTFEPLRPLLSTLLDSPAIDSPEFTFELCGIRVVGRLRAVRECGLVHIRLRKLQARDRVRLFLEHLVGSVGRVLGDAPSRLVALDGHVTLPSLDAAAAEPLLEPWLTAWRQGLFEPLPFFPRSAFAYLGAGDGERALAAAKREWIGSDYRRGECEDPYYRKVYCGRIPIDEHFEQIVRSVLAPTAARLEKA